MLETLTLSEANFTKNANPETLLLEKEIRILLNAKADKLTDLLTQKADQTEIEKVSNEIKELEHELDDIKAELKQNSPVYSAVKNPDPFNLAEFQNKVLDENSLLLEFSFGNEESYLWLVGKNEINLYFLPPREQIENRIEKLAELLTSRKMRENESIEEYRARINEAEKSYWQEAQILSRELFGQFAEKLSDKRLIIVSDGKLHFFPVSALPFPNSNTNEPILLKNEVVYEPSASMLLLLAKNGIRSPENLKNLLVFTDPVFKTDDSRLPAELNSDKTSNNENPAANSVDSLRFVESLNSLPRLTASKEEGDSIVQIVGASKTDIFSGFSANRQQFLNANLSNYKIIHLATHGLVNEERPELSGIILSRFDETGQKLDEFVRLQDIYALNLNADLVVLSACDTGIGKELNHSALEVQRFENGLKVRVNLQG
jgi:CHAT domain-containing protein